MPKASISKSLAIKSILSSSLGNVIEWYEYTLYAYFATVIRDLFFPAGNPYVAMLLTFATFAVGLAARPLGGLIFGYIGDRYSRKRMLTWTMLLMSLPTLGIGLLPTYQQIGIAAPLCLVFLRILQGIALGGEFGASCVYLFESVPPAKRGFFGTLALTGVGTGLVLSACTILGVELWISEKNIYAFAWRLPFFISVTGALIGFYMRSSLLESQDFVGAKERQELVANPFMEMLRHHKRTLGRLLAIFLTTQIAFFTVFIFGKTMMIELLGYGKQAAGKINLLTVVSYTLTTLVVGYFSDKVNKRYLIIMGALGIFSTIYPFIWALKMGHHVLVVGLSLALGALIGMTEGTLNPVAASSFPTNIRATSIACCWNVTAVVFGGAAPLISMWLTKYFGQIEVVAYYLMTACLVTISVTLYTVIKDRKREVAQSEAPMTIGDLEVGK